MKCIVLLLLLAQAKTQLISPCPRLFQYEPQGSENDRWYATVTLISDAELSGVWLRLIFDKPSIQLGNWFGEVVTTDNKEYLIKNRNHKLAANIPYKLRFYLKYNPGEKPPQLVIFRLNARLACPENGVTTEAPVTTGQLITSSLLSTTRNPLANSNSNNNNNNNQGTTFVKPGGAFNQQTTNSGDDDDFSHGDFAIFHRPKPSLDAGAACGTVVMPSRPLITHGQATHEGEFPWHAALFHATGIDLTYICGASLITRYHLLTVAHCVTVSPKSQEKLDPGSLVVYLGKYYLKRWSNPGIQDKHVDKITVHPDYKSQVFTNDIAILRMASPVELTNYVRPVCLWDENTQLQAVINKAGTVVGWGFDENGRVTEQLTKAKMPVVSQETCIYSFPDFYSRFTSDKTYCAGFKNVGVEGTSVCNGDSGGGMVFPKSNSNLNNPTWQLRGLVSISVALQNQLKCDASHYVVFTDVAKYLDWIKASLN